MADSEPPDDPLDDLLNHWEKQTPSQPRSLETEVWRQIELAERGGPPVPTWSQRIHEAFARPSFAAAFIAACVLLGLFLAEVRSSRLQSKYGAQLAQNYLHLIDPLLSEGGQAGSSSSP